MALNAYQPVSTQRLLPGCALQKPVFPSLLESSPALEAMTDLRLISAATIEPDVSLARATETMIACGVRLLFVVEAAVALVGLITAHDTIGERPVKIIRERGGRHRDLRVRDLMVPTSRIEALDYRDVARAKVGHIVATLEQSGRQHALVVETDPVNGDRIVRGIFSATQIARQMDKPLLSVAGAKISNEIKGEPTHWISSPGIKPHSHHGRSNADAALEAAVKTARAGF